LSSKYYSRIFVGLNSISRNLNNLYQLSKVFIVRFHVIQFTRYSARRSRGELAYINTPFSICQELFSSFFKFLFGLFLFAPPSRTACLY